MITNLVIKIKYLALFVFKEIIVWHLENNKHCFAAFLNAIKAFDNLWRQALYLKMQFALNFIIMLRIYYDKLSSKIKINSELNI